MAFTGTSLLSLPIITTGTESGAWGNITNNGLTQYLDTSIAGALSITSSITLANTSGDASGTNLASTTAQYRTLVVPASGPSANIVITAPSSNRTYHVVNRNATYTVQIRAGANSGVTLGVNQSATVTYNSTSADYELVGVVGASTATDNAVARFDGTTGEIIQNSGATIDDSANFSTTGTATATKLIPTGNVTAGNGMYLPTTNTLAWSNNGSETMRLDSSGNLGIGATPGNRLLVSSPLTGTTPRSNIVLRVQSENTGRDVSIQLSDNVTNAAEIGMVSGNLYFATSAVERVRIDTSGNLLVGTTSGTAQVNITATSAKNVTDWRNYNDVGYGVACLNSSGGVAGSITWTASTTSFSTSSDYRLKENVQPMTGALARVAALKPVTYKWKADGSAGQGFIAHELQEIAPYAVSGEKDGEQMQGVDYGKLTPILTAALQEAITKIETLETRIAVLEAK